jgi:hypothetical protein
MAILCVRICLLLFAFFIHKSDFTLIDSPSNNRIIQQAIRHDHLTLVLDGVQKRARNSVQPDPLLLLLFPDADQQLKVSSCPYFCHNFPDFIYVIS